MDLNRRTARIYGAALVLVWVAQYTGAHVDAPRTTLPQLFLEAEFVAIGHVESVEMRSFRDGADTSQYEVVTATVDNHYKGEALIRIEFFQYGHGHALFQPGDTAVIFLQVLDEQHQLYRIGSIGGINYVSHQVRNTEHRLNQLELADYSRVLETFAAMDSGNNPDRSLQALSQILLSMLLSDSPKLVESALLDWKTSGNTFYYSREDIAKLSGVVRDTQKPIGLRLALLKEMSSRGLANESEWVYLLENESDENLQFVLGATLGQESKLLRDPLVSLLDHSSEFLVGSAARALGNPIYSGAEKSLKALLQSENQQLNYAAAHGLTGIGSSLARVILSDAAQRHPNPKVRRMISARLGLLDLSQL